MFSKRVKTIIVILTAAAVLQGLIAFATAEPGKDVISSIINAISKKEEDRMIVENDENKKTSKTISDEEAFKDLTQNKKNPENSIEVSDIEIPSDMEELLKKVSDEKGKKKVMAGNANKQINNYKKLVNEFRIPDRYNDEIKRLLQANHDPSDIFIAYEFLYDNYGLIQQLEEFISKKEKGEKWEEVFEEYYQANGEFVPRDFPFGYIEDLIKNKGFTPDDVMNADRVSRKGIKSFDELMDMKKKGKSWTDVNQELGVVNTAAQTTKVSVTGVEVSKYMKEYGMDENQVVSAVAMARKKGLEDKELLEKAKNHKSKGKISAEILEKKFE